jgi:flagellar hook-basal body complex protein FliE
MTLYGPNEVNGDLFNLQRTHPDHLPGKNDVSSRQEMGGFQELLMGSLNEVNNAQQAHADLAVQAVVDPDAVDPHDVTIAGAKANLALSMTRNVVDRVIQAYRDITNVR